MIGELLERIEQNKIGVKVGDTLINIMALADELVSITEKPGDMKIPLQMCDKFFSTKKASQSMQQSVPA